MAYSTPEHKIGSSLPFVHAKPSPFVAYETQTPSEQASTARHILHALNASPQYPATPETIAMVISKRNTDYLYSPLRRENETEDDYLFQKFFSTLTSGISEKVHVTEAWEMLSWLSSVHRMGSIREHIRPVTYRETKGLKALDDFLKPALEDLSKIGYIQTGFTPRFIRSAIENQIPLTETAKIHLLASSFLDGFHIEPFNTVYLRKHCPGLMELTDRFYREDERIPILFAWVARWGLNVIQPDGYQTQEHFGHCVRNEVARYVTKDGEPMFDDLEQYVFPPVAYLLSNYQLDRFSPNMRRFWQTFRQEDSSVIKYTLIREMEKIITVSGGSESDLLNCLETYVFRDQPPLIHEVNQPVRISPVDRWTLRSLYQRFRGEESQWTKAMNALDGLHRSIHTPTAGRLAAWSIYFSLVSGNGRGTADVETTDQFQDHYASFFFDMKSPQERYTRQILTYDIPLTSDGDKREAMKTAAKDVERISPLDFLWVHNAIHEHIRIDIIEYMESFYEYLLNPSPQAASRFQTIASSYPQTARPDGNFFSNHDWASRQEDYPRLLGTFETLITRAKDYFSPDWDNLGQFRGLKAVYDASLRLTNDSNPRERTRILNRLCRLAQDMDTRDFLTDTLRFHYRVALGNLFSQNLVKLTDYAVRPYVSFGIIPPDRAKVLGRCIQKTIEFSGLIGEIDDMTITADAVARLLSADNPRNRMILLKDMTHTLSQDILILEYRWQKEMALARVAMEQLFSSMEWPRNGSSDALIDTRLTEIKRRSISTIFEQMRDLSLLACGLPDETKYVPRYSDVTRIITDLSRRRIKLTDFSRSMYSRAQYIARYSIPGFYNRESGTSRWMKLYANGHTLELQPFQYGMVPGLLTYIDGNLSDDPVSDLQQIFPSVRAVRSSAFND